MHCQDCPAGDAARINTDLIGSSAIRISRKPPEINHLKISNRHKTRVSWTAAALRRLSIAAAPISTGGQCASEPPPKLLIGSPVIRIFRNPPRINRLRISNRHKTLSFAKPASSRLAPLPPEPFLSNLEHPTSNLHFLIGPPVIRIRSKPFRISADFDSNRREIRPPAH